MDPLKAQLKNMKLHEFGNNVAKMLTKMQTIYNTLKIDGHTPNSFHCYVYTALKTGPNADFNLLMERIIDEIQLGIEFNQNINANELIIAVHTKYNNMAEDKTWGKMDLHDAKILALTMKLKKLEKEGAIKLNAVAHATDGKALGREKKYNPLEEWYKKFDGDTKEIDGWTYWWCKHHTTKDYNGLYVSSHSPVNHEAWSKDIKDCTGKHYLVTPVIADASKPEGDTPKSTLCLNDCLWNDLMTNVCLLSWDINKIFMAAS